MAKAKPKRKPSRPSLKEPTEVADSIWRAVSSVTGAASIPSYDEWAVQQPGTYEPSVEDFIQNDNSILPNCRLSIYFASKTNHAHIGKLLQTSWTEFTWTSRWPLYVGKVEHFQNEAMAKIGWEYDLADIQAANVVLVFSKSEDTLRGALVEAGMAIALGKKVLVVGENDSYGTWQYHPLVLKARDIAEARQVLRTLAI